MTKSYWVTVHVRLHAPLESDDGSTVAGYYRTLGLRSTEGELPKMIAAEASDGVVDWSETTWEPRTVSEMPAKLQRSCDAAEPVWFRSGRMFYSDEGEPQM